MPDKIGITPFYGRVFVRILPIWDNLFMKLLPNLFIFTMSPPMNVYINADLGSLAQTGLSQIFQELFLFSDLVKPRLAVAQKKR